MYESILGYLVNYFDRNRWLFGHFWDYLWGMIDIKWIKGTTFHSQRYRQTKVVNKIMVHMLQGYNVKHPKTWDKS